MLERHGAALRAYLGTLPGADATKVEPAMREISRELEKAGELDDDPAVWLFAHARRQMLGAGQRGDVLLGEAAGAADEEENNEGQDARVAVHRAFARLTAKQQEALRLRFQFGFNPEEMARITGLSLGGAEGLMEHALGRIVPAMPAAEGKAAVRITDPRIIGYALDEMGAAEKRAFVEAASGGKDLLETADAIRRAVRTLTEILQNGAPPPRRKRRGGVPVAWVILGVVALLTVAGAVWWFAQDRGMALQDSKLARSVAAQDGGAAGEAHTPENDGVATTSRVRKREARPGEADWERKAFGRGSGQGAGLTGEGGGVADSAGDSSSRENSGGGVAPRADLPGEPEPEVGRRERDEAPAVLLPGGAGGAGAVAGGVPDKAPTAGPGAWAGTTNVESRVVQAGEPTSVTLPTSAGMARAPEPGLKDLQRALARREWPAAQQVNPGALLQQAPPEWPAPGAQPVPLAVGMEMAPSPFTPGRQVVRVVVQAKPAPPPVRPPANLVLAIDVSDSMNTPNRLPLVQTGVWLLAERLRPDDRVAVVTYAATAREVRGSEPIGEGGRELRDVLAGLSAEGRTNGYEGLTLAYATAQAARSESGINAVILCTDGNFNLGETDEQALAALAGRFAAEGIKLSVFGFGRSDRNDLRLELLAQQGGGQSCYVNTAEEAERLLAGQIEGLLEPVAREVDWRVDFNPARVADVRPLGGQERGVASELLPGRNLTALYELTLRPGNGETSAALGRVRVNFLPAGERRPTLMQQTLVAPPHDWLQVSPGFRFAVAVTELGRIMQSGPAQARPALERLEEWVVANLPDDAGGYRRELRETLIVAREAAGHGSDQARKSPE